MAFPSVYEMTNPLTTVRKQHFWEYFSGSKLQEGVTGTTSYSTDFPNSTGWLSTAGGVSIGNNELRFETTTNGSNTAISYDLGSTQSNSWTLRAKVRYNTQGHNSVGYAHGMIFGLSSAPYTTTSESAQDFIGSTAMHDNVDRAQGAVWADGTKLNYNNTCSGSDGTYGSPVTVAGACNPSANVWGANQTRWVEIKRTGALTATVSYYPDANYTTPTATRIIPITTEPTGLRYISFRNLNPSRTESGGETIIVDDLSFTSDTIGGTRWTTINPTGTGTFTMADSVDGGFTVKSDTSGYAKSAIYFGNKRQFKGGGSVCIGSMKNSVAGGGAYGYMGLSKVGYDTADFAYMGKPDNANNTNFVLATSSGSSPETTANASTTVTQDTSFHTFKMVLSASNVVGTIDGVLASTNSTSIPTETEKLQPTVLNMNNNSGSGNVTSIRYMECYNT